MRTRHGRAQTALVKAMTSVIVENTEEVVSEMVFEAMEERKGDIEDLKKLLRETNEKLSAATNRISVLERAVAHRKS